MKKNASIIISILMLTAISCSDKKDMVDLPQIYFEQPHYILAKGDITIRLVADIAAPKKIEIPFTLVGKAVEGTDFTCVKKKFVFEAGSTESTVTFTRIEENIADDSKDLTINLGAAPEGFRLGVINFATIELFGNQSVFITFDNDMDKLTETGEYNVSLERMNGTKYKASATIQFPVEIDPASTAIEGVHFEFDKGKYATVKKNKNQGSVSLKFLKKEEDKNKLILRLKNKEGFAFGRNAAININIQGTYSLLGTWSYMKMSNYDWFKSAYENMINMSNFPTGTGEDKITFSGNQKEYTFIPNLKGDLKNFFIESCKATYMGEEKKDFQELATSGRYMDEVAIVLFEKVNVNFSSSKQKIRESKLGFRILTIDDEEVLECTIDDFEPTDFLMEAYEMMGDMTYTPLRLHFKREK